ncbi:MAG: hypothetical protein QOJ04_2031 [Caballeronia sp.]|nr:hypothetical protein [Caballeronia sp.]
MVRALGKVDGADLRLLHDALSRLLRYTRGCSRGLLRRRCRLAWRVRPEWSGRTARTCRRGSSRGPCRRCLSELVDCCRVRAHALRVAAPASHERTICDPALIRSFSRSGLLLRRIGRPRIRRASRRLSYTRLSRTVPRRGHLKKGRFAHAKRLRRPRLECR